MRLSVPERPRSERPRLLFLLAAFLALSVFLVWMHGRPLPRRAPGGRGGGSAAATEDPPPPDASAALALLPEPLCARLRAAADGGRFPRFLPEEWAAARAALDWLGEAPEGDLSRRALGPFPYRRFGEERFRAALRGAPLRVRGQILDLRLAEFPGAEGEPPLEGLYAYLSPPDPAAPSGYAVYALSAGSLRNGDPASCVGLFWKLAYTFDAATGEKAQHPVFLAKRIAYAPE